MSAEGIYDMDIANVYSLWSSLLERIKVEKEAHEKQLASMKAKIAAVQRKRGRR